MNKNSHTYIAIDLKSFYASVECVERGLDALSANLVVADESRTDKTICLAVSPSLKAFGIKGRPRLFEVVQKVREINRQNPGLNLSYIVAKPRMALYIDYSTRIYGIYLRHIAAEDIHVYSIDEVFIDATPYLRTYGLSAHDLALKLVREVLKETGITATAGVGSNMYLAKVAMDIIAKHIPSDADGVRIAELDELGYRRNLWHHTPLTDFWRVGGGIARKLAMCGVFTMGDLARYSVVDEDALYKIFGVNAELLIDHAWGWEPCTIAQIKAYNPQSSSMSIGQVLQSAYTVTKARVVLMEMADQLALDLVGKGQTTNQVIVAIGYDRESLLQPDIARNYYGEVCVDHYGRHVPKSVNGSGNLPCFTSSSEMIVAMALQLFDRLVDTQLLVRRINVVASHVVSEKKAVMINESPKQMSLFVDYEAEIKRNSEMKHKLGLENSMQHSLLSIKSRFGKNAILRGTSFKDGATARERNMQIGGHSA